MAVNKITDGTTDVFFFAIRGQMYDLARTFADESRQGEDGTAYRLLGIKPTPFTLQFECHVDTYAAAKTLGLFLYHTRGFVVDIVQEGTTNINCLLTEVVVDEPEMMANIRRGIYPADGTIKNGAGAEFRCLMTFIYTDNNN
jgi:hypothetical protein